MKTNNHPFDSQFDFDALFDQVIKAHAQSKTGKAKAKQLLASLQEQGIA